MNELIFRGKDRFRPDAADIALLLMVLTAELLAGRMKFHLGPVPMTLLVGGTVLPIAAARLIAMRYLVRVNADGVTISWGLGRGRTYSWQQISWVDVSEIPGRNTTTRIARIHTTDGRRHWLSTLVTSDFHPLENFDAEFRQVDRWWKHSTSPDRRIRPGMQFRDRITPTKAAVVGIVVFAVVFFVVTVLL